MATNILQLEPPLLLDNYTYLNITGVTFSETLRIRDIQGTGLVSSLTGTPVSNVAGIVTAIASNGFYLQDPDPDDDPRTSEGIFVFTGSRNLGVNGLNITVGASVRVSGEEVEERRPRVNVLDEDGNPVFDENGNPELEDDLTVLSVTRIRASLNRNRIEVVSSGNPLPAPILIGSGGRVPPNQIIAGTNFSPDTFDIGLWTSQIYSLAKYK